MPDSTSTSNPKIVSRSSCCTSAAAWCINAQSSGDVRCLHAVLHAAELLLVPTSPADVSTVRRQSKPMKGAKTSSHQQCAAPCAGCQRQGQLAVLRQVGRDPGVPPGPAETPSRVRAPAQQPERDPSHWLHYAPALDSDESLENRSSARTHRPPDDIHLVHNAAVVHKGLRDGGQRDSACAGQAARRKHERHAVRLGLAAG